MIMGPEPIIKTDFMELSFGILLELVVYSSEFERLYIQLFLSSKLTAKDTLIVPP